MTPTIVMMWVVVLAALVIVFGAVLRGLKEIKDLIKGFLKVSWSVIKSPLKAISTIRTANLERKIARETKKRDKALMKEDYKARLNSARNNTSYAEAKAVRKHTNKMNSLIDKRK